MQISSRFTIAIHMLIIIALEGKETKVTSDFLAASVGVNPVIIRKTLSQLKNAELISVARGTGGTEIIKDLQDISLFDVYQAVECLGKSGKLFSFHDNPNPNCPVGANIHEVLDQKLLDIQEAMENQLRQTSLAQIVADAQDKMTK
ncbi:putative HTH-type transcriptional regulator YwnA [Streptococcus oralis subsp. dentisani]|uniref:Putative HTH-type transcriptional regulator YwnA n=1 Tax=Streptococcus oralis subsp. dentisani TaxID=1458253 RepID=A0A428FYM8_STROR|nr:Rrf2 family transcriptional regulator [Streptococcus oralis]RSJ67821.1 putative HTH-type transcriptional regulator YwnA [Streptococcus oralis subsp. dentisani]